MPISMKTYNFTLRQIQYMVAVADALSFRRAAERCNVSQPSLSAQIAEMEAALGVPLFERDRARGYRDSCRPAARQSRAAGPG